MYVLHTGNIFSEPFETKSHSWFFTLSIKCLLPKSKDVLFQKHSTVFNVSEFNFAEIPLIHISILSVDPMSFITFFYPQCLYDIDTFEE